MCPMDVSPTCLRRQYSSNSIYYSSNCPMQITDEILKAKSSIMKRIFRNIFSLLKFNYQMKIFSTSRRAKGSKFIVFMKTSASKEIL